MATETQSGATRRDALHELTARGGDLVVARRAVPLCFCGHPLSLRPAGPRSGRSRADSPLQESATVRYAILWRDGQTHVDVVRLSVTFDRFSSLLEHLSKD